MRQAQLVSLAVGIVLAMSFAVIRTHDPLELRLAREMIFDGFQRLAPREYQPQGVRIVDIDEVSLARIGQWPWPRSNLAKLVERLDGMGAAVVAFDMVFPEPDRMSPSQLVLQPALRAVLDTGMADRLIEQLPDNDAEFARAIAGAATILGFGVLPGENDNRPIQKAALASTGQSPHGILPFFAAAVVNLNKLELASSGLGTITLSPLDQQGIVRRIPLVWSDGRRIYPSLALEALRVLQKEKNILIHSTHAPPYAVTALKIGQVEVPVTRAGEMRLRFGHDIPNRYISAARILSDEAPSLRKLIEDHVVFVGTSAAGLLDTRATPLAETVPGVSLHAQALEQILSGHHLIRPDWVDGLEIGWLLIFAGIIIGAATFMTPMAAFVIGGTIAGLTLAVSWIAFSLWGLLLDPAFPSLVGLMLYFVLISFRFFVTDRDRIFLQRAFARYLAPSVLADVLKNPAALHLGGEECELTILFMDVRDFTGISEQLTPTEVVNFLNVLLGALSQDVLTEGGTIDKYIGDSIMAFWNAPLKSPDHAVRACRAALRMRNTLQELNARDAFRFRQSSLKLPDPRIGIGLNTGPSLVGNMGSEFRFNYSAVGDAVNVAARIEGLAKVVGAEIVVSASVQKAAENLAFLEVGALGLRGRSELAEIYILVGDELMAAATEFKQLKLLHRALLDTISNEAADCMSPLLKCHDFSEAHFPELRSFYQIFAERLGSSIPDRRMLLSTQPNTSHLDQAKGAFACPESTGDQSL